MPDSGIAARDCNMADSAPYPRGCLEDRRYLAGVEPGNDSRDAVCATRDESCILICLPARVRCVACGDCCGECASEKYTHLWCCGCALFAGLQCFDFDIGSRTDLSCRTRDRPSRHHRTGRGWSARSGSAAERVQTREDVELRPVFLGWGSLFSGA